MERFVNTKKSRIKTMIVLILISLTVSVLFRSILPIYFITPIVFFAIMGPYFYFVILYLRDKRGYQDRYQRQGGEMQMQQSVMRIIALILAVVFFYAIVGAIMRELAGIDNPFYALIITIVVTVAAVQIVDFYAGKDVEDYVQHKRKSHRDFVTSLGTAEGMCMSCRKNIGTGVRICPHCGYEQKEIGKDSSYIAES